MSLLRRAPTNCAFGDRKGAEVHMKRSGNPVIAFVLGLIAMGLGIRLFGPCLGPLVFFSSVFLLMRARAASYADYLDHWAGEQALPDGQWLIRLNNLATIGNKTVDERLIEGQFSKVARFIGPRTPEEVERIRAMVIEASQGGYNWVTLYNPIGLPKELEAEAPSTITIRFDPLPDTT
jgi:hypothetical protein